LLCLRCHATIDGMKYAIAIANKKPIARNSIIYPSLILSSY
jgi:hypothetical protein